MFVKQRKLFYVYISSMEALIIPKRVFKSEMEIQLNQIFKKQKLK